MEKAFTLILGDCVETLKQFPDSTIQAVITSPPYWGLRDYGHSKQIGCENTLDDYIENLVVVFREIRRVLTTTGTLWINIGDAYNAGRNGGHPGGVGLQLKNSNQRKYQNKCGANVDGLKPKDLIGIPWRLAFALQKDGWYLRQDIIWHKPNPMPESIKDRCTKSHEYIFLLSKSYNYFFNSDAIQETTVDGVNKKNRRSVWTVPVSKLRSAHTAVYPLELIYPCIKAASNLHDIVLDPFMGSGTTGVASLALDRRFVGIEIAPEYYDIAKQRMDTLKQV